MATPAREPLLSTHSDSGHLSLGMAAKLKAKAHHWKMKYHHVDAAFAIGGKCASTAAVAAKEEAGEAAEDPAQTNGEAITNLLNNMLGSGVLAVPHAIKECGLGVALPLLFASLLLNRFALLLIGKISDTAGLSDPSYTSIGKFAFGNPGRLMVIFIMFCMAFGCLVSYVDATLDAAKDLGGTFTGSELSWGASFFISLLMLFPPTYIRSLKSAATLSFVAFLGAIVVVICVVAQCSMDLSKAGLPSADMLRWYPNDVSVLFAMVPVLATVFSIQAGGSIILSSLQDSSLENKSKVATNAYLISFAINVVLAVPAYLAYRDAVKGDVLATFPNGPIIIVAKIAVLDLVVLSYMFMMIPCRVASIQFLFGKNAVKQEETYMQFVGTTTVINLAAAGLAALVSDLSLVIGLVGSVAVNFVAFILPSAIWIKINSMEDVATKNGKPVVPMMAMQNLPFHILITYALCSMVLGLKTQLASLFA